MSEHKWQLTTITKAVCKQFGIAPEEIGEFKNREARQLLLYVAHSAAGYSYPFLANYVGRHFTSVSGTIDRARDKILAKDRGFEYLVRDLKQILTSASRRHGPDKDDPSST